jgi:hypothetical protein
MACTLIRLAVESGLWSHFIDMCDTPTFICYLIQQARQRCTYIIVPKDNEMAKYFALNYCSIGMYADMYIWVYLILFPVLLVQKLIGKFVLHYQFFSF